MALLFINFKVQIVGAKWASNKIDVAVLLILRNIGICTNVLFQV